MAAPGLQTHDGSMVTILWKARGSLLLRSSETRLSQVPLVPSRLCSSARSTCLPAVCVFPGDDSHLIRLQGLSMEEANSPGHSWEVAFSCRGGPQLRTADLVYDSLAPISLSRTTSLVHWARPPLKHVWPSLLFCSICVPPFLIAHSWKYALNKPFT